MNSSRLEQLKKFLKDDPNDPFTLYAIATEYRTEQPAEAKVYFDRLLAEHPDYLATYYHAAQLYRDMEEIDIAKSMYESGIDLAKKQNNQLALRELQNAYNELLFEEE